MEKQPEIIQYETSGTCCKLMQVALQDGKVIDAQFYGGCGGNLQGIRSLIIGMDIDDVITKLKGIQCGPKPTSCPDQLAQCLLEYKAKTSANITN